MRLGPFKRMCAAGLFAIFSSTLSKSPVLPLFAAHLGASPAEVGVVAAASTLAGIAFSLPAGILSDRFGRRAMLVAAGVVFASAPLMYLFIRGVWPLAAVRFYHGLATAIFMPVAMALVSDLHEESKGEKLGWFSTATLLGRFTAPLAGGAVLAGFGVQDPGFTVLFSICLGSGLAALFLSARIRPDGDRPPMNRTLKGLATDLVAVVANGPLAALGLVEAAVLFMYGTLEVFVPLFGIAQGMGAFEVGVCLAAQVITLAVAKPIMGRFSDRHGRSPQIVWGALLGAAASAGMAAAGGFAGLLALSALTGFSLSIVTSATSAAVADTSRTRLRGSAMGVFGTIMDIGHSAGPLVSGLIVARFGYGAAFVGAAAVVAAAGVMFKLTAASRVEQGRAVA